MFTGIVEAIGTVVEIAATQEGRRIRVRATKVGDGLASGGSIAVDGACLTVVESDPEGFAVDVIEATLDRTVAGRYQEGTRVNLERALRLGDRLDGHLVQGHVDGMGEVVTLRGGASPQEQRLVELALPGEVAAATIPLGSLTVNGVSLTVDALPAPGRCRVALIPHTRRVTTLDQLRAGDPVNLEGDLIGKYVGKMLTPWRAAVRSPEPGQDP